MFRLRPSKRMVMRRRAKRFTLKGLSWKTSLSFQPPALRWASLAVRLAKTPATELGAMVIREAIARAGLASDQVGEVIMGQVLAAGVGQNPARQAMMKAGVAKETPALTINAVCGSGLKAVMLAAQAVA